jgi:hypothetical protein
MNFQLHNAKLFLSVLKFSTLNNAKKWTSNICSMYRSNEEKLLGEFSHKGKQESEALLTDQQQYPRKKSANKTERKGF